jgi:hypothetical protein
LEPARSHWKCGLMIGLPPGCAPLRLMFSSRVAESAPSNDVGPEVRCVRRGVSSQHRFETARPFDAPIANPQQNAGWVPGIQLFAAIKVVCLAPLPSRCRSANLVHGFPPTTAVPEARFFQPRPSGPPGRFGAPATQRRTSSVVAYGWIERLLPRCSRAGGLLLSLSR